MGGKKSYFFFNIQQCVPALNIQKANQPRAGQHCSSPTRCQVKMSCGSQQGFQHRKMSQPNRQPSMRKHAMPLLVMQNNVPRQPLELTTGIQN